ncbi:MAG: hypothetical protein PHH49_02425 [Candidatus Omnitrophica bacterium]|nr:hypothetical protein [Candidatus Omnitrophota bacterium]MDD5487803.1 hypothetical protein [Candidatus Omnitrophota bacterium]
MRKICACITAIMFLFSNIAVAYNSPEEAKADAFSKIKVSASLMEQAQKILSFNPNRERITTAMDLYIQAGKGFEEALNVFKALGEEYVTQEDLQGCAMALQNCLYAIAKCKELLDKL